MKSKLTNSAKKFTWAFFWSGNFPIHISYLWNDVNYQRAFQKISGIHPKAALGFTTKGMITQYHAEEEYNRLNKYFVAKFNKDPKFLIRSARVYRPQVNKDLAALKQINKIDNLAEFSNAELGAFMLRAHKHFAYNAAIDLYDWYMEKFLIPGLQSYLLERLEELGKTHLIAEYVNTLITPHQVSVVFKERQQLFGIIKSIRKSPALSEAVKRNSSSGPVLKKYPVLARKLEKYLADYCWVSIHMNNPPNTMAGVWKEVREWIKNGKPLKIKAKRLGDDYDRAVIRKSHAYMRELKPPAKMKLLIEGLRAMTFLRTEDYVVMGQSAYFIIPLYKEMAKRLGVTVQELKDFVAPEIIGYLASGKKIPRSEVASRRKLTGLLILDKEWQTYTGKEARDFHRYIEKAEKARLNPGAGTLSGLPAVSGKFRGPARVALDPKVANKVKKTEVLVGKTLSVMFTTALRQAGAIVAEYGGLVSHPVIVAREFNIPCVVGVRGVTQRIKTGDLVEVDADSGTIKVIKRK